MKIPEPIYEFFRKNKWIPVLIFGIFIGSSFLLFIQNERFELLKSQIDEYRERLKIPKPNEGPYNNYTNNELKNRALKVSIQIKSLCEKNPLLSIEKYYREKIDAFKENPAHIEGNSPFGSGQLLFLYENIQYMKAIDQLRPSITQEDVGRTWGNLSREMYMLIHNAIKPELDIYKSQYRNDVIALKNEMLSRMPPRAYRRYRGHVDIENPQQFLIGVAIQLEEISEDF